MSFLLVHAKLNLTELDADSIVIGLSMFRCFGQFVVSTRYSILKLTCKYSQVNKTLSLWKAQSNALSRVSPSRWGVTKPDVVVLNSEYLLLLLLLLFVFCVYIYKWDCIRIRTRVRSVRPSIRSDLGTDRGAPHCTTRGNLLTATARDHKHRHVRRVLTLVHALIPLYSYRQHHVAMVHRPCQKGRTIHEPYAWRGLPTAARGRRGG